MTARTVVFLPQVIPLVAAGIAWSWLLSKNGLINQVLSAVGLGDITRAWLADFGLALPAVGVIGAWVLLGLCTILLLTGMSKIDQALYEAARIDGANAWQEFRSITVPSLRHEIGVCITVTVIAALSSFDIIYISTLGGPGTRPPSRALRSTGWPSRRQSGSPRRWLSCSWCWYWPVLPIQRLTREDPTMIVGRSGGLDRADAPDRADGRDHHPVPERLHHGLAPLGHRAPGFEWPADPQWGNLPEAFEQAHMDALLVSSVIIVVGVVPASVVLATMAGFAIGPAHPGVPLVFILFLLGLTLPLVGIIIPLYYLVRSLGFYDTNWRSSCRSSACTCRSGCSGCGRTSSTCRWSSPRPPGWTGPRLASFWRVQVPLARPAVASLAILLGVWTWNQFLLALVLVEDPLERTMAGALGTFQGQYGTDLALLSPARC